MKVSEVMSYDARIVDVLDPVQCAAEIMRAAVVGILPVVDDGELVGVITDRDIATRSTARDQRPSRTRVRDVMTTEPTTCLAEETVAVAAARMIERGVRRLIVIDGAKRIAGILSIDDLALTDETRGVAMHVLHQLAARRGVELDGTFAEVRQP